MCACVSCHHVGSNKHEDFARIEEVMKNATNSMGENWVEDSPALLGGGTW